ncbi:AarF/UbiB family protein [Kitasatospora sp. NPDC002040]|uniref:ABC1 kinase family protein n=1 Tax=Kitasatospora sp. NPDC002040 TaxID=3154661 RepID=UPI0033212D46
MTAPSAPIGSQQLARRAGQIVLVLGRHLVRAGAATAVRQVTPRRLRRGHAHAVPALLAELGPFFVKGGQLLSTRRDLLPPALCRALGGLTDRVPAPGREEIRAIVESVHGPEHDWPFTSVDWAPVAAGSIATVHRAVLRDGRTVALKIRRPGIAATMATDLRLATAVARCARWVPSLRRVPAEEMVGQVGGAILRQLDFALERRSLHVLRKNLADLPGLRLPLPDDALSTDETVVMEFMTDLGRFRPDALDPEARREVVRTVLQAVYRMLFLDGTVHCDLHPGNLYLTGQGEVVILDGGFVVQLPDHVRRLFGEFFLNMALGRGRRCADITIESAAVVDPDCDVAGFRDRVEKLVAEATLAVSKDFNLAEFAPKLFQAQRDFGVYAAAEFAFPLLSLLVLEGMVKEFDSDVDFQSEAIPVLFEAASSTPASLPGSTTWPA